MVSGFMQAGPYFFSVLATLFEFKNVVVLTNLIAMVWKCGDIAKKKLGVSFKQSTNWENYPVNRWTFSG